MPVLKEKKGNFPKWYRIFVIHPTHTNFFLSDIFFYHYFCMIYIMLMYQQKLYDFFSLQKLVKNKNISGNLA